MRKDISTSLYLWTFQRKNPLADGGTLPLDDPVWPGPLKEVMTRTFKHGVVEFQGAVSVLVGM